MAVSPVFLCFAEIGSRVTRSGGAYAYIEEAFGPFAGFIASILFWFSWSVLSDAAITVAMVETIAIAFPILAETIPRALFKLSTIAAGLEPCMELPGGVNVMRAAESVLSQ